jgi:hypothetical protein
MADISELIRRTKEQAEINKKKRLEQDRMMDKLIAKQIPSHRFEKEDEIDTEEWHFEHDDLSCRGCKDGTLSFYIGTYNGEDAHKYECDSCDFEEIELIKNM